LKDTIVAYLLAQPRSLRTTLTTFKLTAYLSSPQTSSNIFFDIIASPLHFDGLECLPPRYIEFDTATRFDPTFMASKKPSRDCSIPREAEVSARASPLEVLQQRETGQQLCARCASIDLDNVFGYEFKADDYMKEVKELGHISSIHEHSTCPLCRLFALMRPTSVKAQVYRLMAFGSRVFEYQTVENDPPRPAKLGVQETVLLGIIPSKLSGRFEHLRSAPEVIAGLRETGFICSLTHSSQPSSESSRCFRGNVLSPTHADLVMLKSWIEYCQEHHSSGCGDHNFGIASPDVPGFQVIDCKTRQVVPATIRCHYVALSYVWGSSLANGTYQKHNKESLLQENLPKTIEDAIIVTLQLGFRYLWVDYYCIDQDNEIEKVEQIQHMALIYEMAQLTIVAAAGADPSFGLPGVRATSRQIQPNVTIGNHLLVSTLPDAQSVIKQSKWITRSWTYQEALLSRRLLIFTQHQVYFECRSMHCSESPLKPLSAMHSKGLPKLNWPCRPGLFLPINFKFLTLEPRTDFLKVLNQYTSRSLSYSSDILNAVLGVLQLFQLKPVWQPERDHIPIYHYFGVPILPPLPLFQPSGSFWESDRQCQPRKVFGGGFAHGLMWCLTSPSKRRAGFPSWSWTGWEGTVDNTYRQSYHIVYDSASSFSDPKFQAETRTRKVIEWDDLMTMIQTKDHQALSKLSSILIVEAYTFKVRFYRLAKGDHEARKKFGRRWYAKSRQRPELADWRENCDLGCFSPTIEITDDLARRLVEEEWDAIILNIQPDRFMVVDWRHGVAERIGFLGEFYSVRDPAYPQEGDKLDLVKKKIRLG
jgi:hypothetical protein